MPEGYDWNYELKGHATWIGSISARPLDTCVDRMQQKMLTMGGYDLVCIKLHKTHGTYLMWVGRVDNGYDWLTGMRVKYE